MVLKKFVLVERFSVLSAVIGISKDSYLWIPKYTLTVIHFIMGGPIVVNKYKCIVSDYLIFHLLQKEKQKNRKIFLNYTVINYPFVHVHNKYYHPSFFELF